MNKAERFVKGIWDNTFGNEIDKMLKVMDAVEAKFTKHGKKVPPEYQAASRHYLQYLQVNDKDTLSFLEI